MERSVKNFTKKYIIEWAGYSRVGVACDYHDPHKNQINMQFIYFAAVDRRSDREVILK